MSLWQNRKMEMAGLYFMFRADPQIGTGHLFRCCKIADFIRRKYGIRFAFNLTGGVRPETRRLLEGRRVFSMGTHVEKLPCFSDRPALIVLDDYSIGFEEELKIRESSYRLIVIDDLMRKHSCDVLIDGNILRTPEDYAASAETVGKMCCGPEYSLVERKFIRARRPRTPPFRRSKITSWPRSTRSLPLRSRMLPGRRSLPRKRLKSLPDRQMQPRRPVIPLRISRIFPQPARSIWTS